MKTIYLLIITLLTMTNCKGENKETVVLIETNYGIIKVRLYDETPLHRDNFIRLVQSGDFENKLFHRVIKDFMIQAGEPDSKLSPDTVFDENNTVAAEFRIPQYFHKRGALAAARWGDFENPTKASTANQFYIATGTPIYDFDLKEIEKQRFERLKQDIMAQLQAESKDTLKALYKEGNKAGMTQFRSGMVAQADQQAEARKSETLFDKHRTEVYKEVGGTPHLDGEYTVFGEVVDGMDVVAKIENARVNTKDRPMEPIKIIGTTVLR